MDRSTHLSNYQRDDAKLGALRKCRCRVRGEWVGECRRQGSGSEGKVEMNYIHCCHSHHSAQNFYAGPCPFPFPIPLPRPPLSAARTPHRTNSHSDLDIRTLTLFATPPFSLFSLSHNPARLLFPSDLDQAMLCFAVAPSPFVIQALATLRTGLFSLPLLLKDVTRRHSYVASLLSNLSSPPKINPTVGAFTHTPCIPTVLASYYTLIYVISTPSKFLSIYL